jgi:hypothetical protein
MEWRLIILFGRFEWSLHAIVNFAMALKHDFSDTDALESRVSTNTLYIGLEIPIVEL